MWNVFLLSLLLILFPNPSSITIVGASNNGNISFQPNSIPDVSCYYEDHTFVFDYKSFFIRVAPFVIHNGTYYNLTQIVTWIKSNYPSVSYKWLVKKAVSSIHYGFNLTSLPQAVADKVDYLGFRLVDLNFPLSYFELEEGYNGTIITIPRANLYFSFEDLYPYGYSVEHINSTYVLVGNVKGKTDLYIDPISFSSNLMTFTGTSTSVFWDFWNASYVNGWNVSCQTCENATTGIGHQDAQFLFQTRLQIGDGSTPTSASDTDVQVTFADGSLSAHGQNIIEVTNNANLTLGTLIDDDDKTVKEGCEIRSLDSYVPDFETKSGSYVELYDVKLSGNPTRSLRLNLDGGGNLYHSYLSSANLILGNTDVILYDIILIDSTIRNYVSLTTAPVMVREFYPSYAILTVAAGYTFQDLYARGIINAGFRFEGTISEDMYVINADLDRWTMSWAGTCTSKLYRQYTFDASIFFKNTTYAQGANVTITNSILGTSDSWLIGSNGSIPQQTYSYGHYNQTLGNTLEDYNPYNISITLSGFTTYTTLLNITQQEDLKITLQEEGGKTSAWVFAGFGILCLILVPAIVILVKKH